MWFKVKIFIQKSFIQYKSMYTKNIKDAWVYISGAQITVDPIQYGVLDLVGSEWISRLYGENGSLFPMITYQLIFRQSVKGGSMIQADPGSRSSGLDPAI